MSSTIGRGGLRGRKKNLRRRRILEAALAAFNAGGFANTTMQQIADEAELAVGTLYNYYPSKNDLLIGIFGEQMRELQQVDFRHIFRLLKAASRAGEVLRSFVEPLVAQVTILTKENWQEIIAALFSARSKMDQLVQLDMEAIEYVALALKVLQRKGLLRRDLRPEAMAETLYALAAVQLLKYIYFPEWSEAQLVDDLTAQLEIALAGMEGTE